MTKKIFDVVTRGTARDLLKSKDCYENFALFKEALARNTTYSTEEDEPLIFTAVNNNQLGYLAVLFQAKHDINRKHRNETALSTAVRKGYVACTELLLTLGATVDIETIQQHLMNKPLKEFSEAQKLILEAAYFSVSTENIATRIHPLIPSIQSDFPLPVVGIIMAYLARQNELLKQNLFTSGLLNGLIQMGEAHFIGENADISLLPPQPATNNQSPKPLLNQYAERQKNSRGQVATNNFRFLA